MARVAWQPDEKGGYHLVKFRDKNELTSEDYLLKEKCSRCKLLNTFLCEHDTSGRQEISNSMRNRTSFQKVVTSTRGLEQQSTSIVRPSAPSQPYQPQPQSQPPPPQPQPQQQQPQQYNNAVIRVDESTATRTNNRDEKNFYQVAKRVQDNKQQAPKLQQQQQQQQHHQQQQQQQQQQQPRLASFTQYRKGSKTPLQSSTNSGGKLFQIDRIESRNDAPLASSRSYGSSNYNYNNGLAHSNNSNSYVFGPGASERKAADAKLKKPAAGQVKAEKKEKCTIL